MGVIERISSVCVWGWGFFSQIIVMVSFYSSLLILFVTCTESSYYAINQVKPPFIPQVNDPRNADCFDPEFTEADTRLSPADPYAIANIDQGVFRNFSFVNEHFFGGKEDSVDVEEDPAVRRPALFDYAWYRPDLPRDEAARHLRGKPVGTFYVRESSSQPGYVFILLLLVNLLYGLLYFMY